MTLWEATLWTWLRSLLISGCALPVIARLSREMTGMPTFSRRTGWAILLLPLLTPGFLVGYAYGRGLLALREWQWGNELTYTLLSLARWVPLGLLIARFAPSGSLSPMAIHGLKLSRGNSKHWPRGFADFFVWFRFGEGKKYLFTFAVLFLVTFHDFDLAALLGASSWCVWLFDAQGAGMNLDESLRRLTGPLAVQLATLAPIFLLAGGNGWNLQGADQETANRPSTCLFLSAWSVAAVLGGCLIPWALVIYEGGAGFTSIFRQGNQWLGLLQEAGNGLVVGTASAISVFSLTRLLFREDHRNRTTRLGLILILPGLLGPLAISLITLRLFGSTNLSSFAPPGLGWLLALILWLIPLGLCLSLGLRNHSVPTAFHLGSLLRDSKSSGQRRAGWRIWWKMRGDEWLWTIVPLVWWSYFDLTISSMLAPPGSVSAPVRLFNQMHYGHSAMLSALTGGAVLIPIILLAVLLGFRRLVLREGGG